MMRRKLAFTFLFVFFGVFAVAQVSQAGFGIQPPYVKPTKAIFAGTHYEQKITLLRSSAEADMKAIVKVTAPEIATWISIDKGEEFDLPKDELRVPMVVKVDVPSDAPIGNYKGHLNIRIEPKEKDTAGGVAIALGARVEIDLTVTDESFMEFIVRKVDIPAIEKLKKPWDWKLFSFFFYRVKVNMKIENAGNTKIAPSKVAIEIFDNAKEKKLEAHVDKSIKKIEPFKTEDVVASFPTELEPGEYWGKISIYKDKEIIQKNEIVFSVYGPGQSPIPVKLGSGPYIMLAGLILIFLIFLYVLFRVRIWLYIGKILYVLVWPFRFVYLKLISLKQNISKKFWKWMHKKASRYQDDEPRPRRRRQ